MKNYSPVVYPGEAVGKKVARVRLYRRAEALFRTGGRPKGWAVVLAGDQACEVWVLRYLLQWDPSRVLFIDRRRKGPALVKKLWPEAVSFHGDIHDALNLCDSIGFAHLDFMGLPTASVRKSIQRVGNLLEPRGIVSYTFSRGRENEYHRRHLRDLYTRARAFSRHNKLPEEKSQDVYRFLGYQLLLEELITKDPLYLALAMRYRRAQAGIAMGSLTFQYMPPWSQTSSWRRELRNDQYSGAIDHHSTENELNQHLNDLRKRMSLSSAVAITM